MSIIEIKIPNVGESVTEATVGEWYKNDGDFVQLDEIIVELETDKATQEFPAEAAGTLKIMAEEGDTVLIGQVIATIDTSATPTASTAPASAAAPQQTTTANAEAPKASGQTLEMNVPAVGESITEVTIGSWLKEDGDIVAMDEILCEIESDKATFELTSEAQGKLKIIAQDGDTLEIGAPICTIEVMTGNIGGTQPTAAPAQTIESTPVANKMSGATPVASNILAEKGMNPNDVNGSGANGKVMKADAVQAQKAAPKAETVAEATPQNVVGARNTERKKLTPLRKTIARRLVSVKNETAMLSTFNEVDMKPIMDIRKKYKEAFKEKHEIGLGFMSFFTKAVCEGLKAWPAVGAQIDGEEIVYHDYCDVAIAVSAPKGLVVPVIRNAETLSFDGIEKEVMRLALKARAGKLSMDEMTGGTFTITNGGIFGSMLSTPIINAPQAAILGMHNIVERPVAINGQVEIRPIMYLALSYDHRIIDGKESVSFLKMVKELLEDPTRLLIGV